MTDCGSFGLQSCDESCRLEECEAPEETCNGFDDDCDGECDEGWDCCDGARETCDSPCGGTGDGWRT